jgi:hypothetical protein
LEENIEKNFPDHYVRNAPLNPLSHVSASTYRNEKEILSIARAAREKRGQKKTQ